MLAGITRSEFCRRALEQAMTAEDDQRRPEEAESRAPLKSEAW